MEIGQRLDLSMQCRLCGNYGDHKFELFDASSGQTSSTWSKKIFRCLDIRVNPSDSTTVICDECFGKLRDFDIYRDICHATNNQIKHAHPRHRNGVTSDVIVKSDVKHEIVIEPVAECVSLSVSNSEFEEAADGLDIQGDLTPKIERSDVVSDAQMNDSAESLVDEKPVFASTSSTAVKHEFPEIATFSSNLEMINNEHVVKSQLDARGNETATNVDCSEEEDNRGIMSDESNVDSPFHIRGSDFETETESDSDGMDSVARVSRMKKEKKLEKRSSRVTFKEEPDVNKKPMKNASKFPVKCSFRGLCPGTFECLEAMKLHLETYHKNRAERSFCCHLCKHTVAKKQNLERHMNAKHTTVVRFMCPNRDCSKIFKNKGNLKRHIDSMHENRVAFRCPKCSKSFTREHLMKKHLSIEHGDGIAFVCYLCNNSFTVKKSLKSHIKSNHTHGRLYKCPEATCAKAFKWKSNMKRHFKKFHSEKTV